MLEKTRTLNVDCVAYDLEDSVTSSKKAEARENVYGFLKDLKESNVREKAVRINSVESGLAKEDLDHILRIPSLDTIVIPKVRSAYDIHFVSNAISRRHKLKDVDFKTFKPVKFLALIESAKAISNLPSICSASKCLTGLIFAAEDFALDLSITRTPSLSEFLYARSAIATAARAHNLESTIDLVCTSYKGDEGQRILEEESLGGKGLGFNGKQCIHPSQVAIVQKAFSPSDEELSWATRIAIADEKADRQGRGAWTLDGKMIDVPVVGKAKSIVIKAKACGMDVEAAREKWQDQEPE